MTTISAARPAASTGSRVSLGSILAAAAIGFALIFTAGLAQSEMLHDAAHDVRHATGFPCH